MDNRYEIAEQNGMSREFADWFFDNKKDGCGNVWFMMMAAMWEGWQGRAAMLQGAEPVSNLDELPDGWVACSERMPEQFVEVLVCTEDGSRYVAALNQSMNWDDGDFFDDIQYVTHWMPLPAAPQQEVKP